MRAGLAPTPWKDQQQDARWLLLEIEGRHRTLIGKPANLSQHLYLVRLKVESIGLPCHGEGCQADLCCTVS